MLCGAAWEDDMARILFTNSRVFDGSGSETFPGEVAVEGNRIAAVAGGGALMGMEGELGQIKPGYLADLLLVDGDPTKDVTILQDRERLLMIMKDGKYHKAPPVHATQPSRVAAE